MAARRRLIVAGVCAAVAWLLVKSSCSGGLGLDSLDETGVANDPVADPASSAAKPLVRAAANRPEPQPVVDAPTAQVAITPSADEVLHHAVEVTVVEFSSGKPVPGATVSRKEPAKIDAEVVGTTDGDGKIRCTVVPREAIRFRIEKATYVTEWTSPLESGGRASVRLRRGAELRVGVCDARGALIQGQTRIWITQQSEQGRGTDVAQATTQDGTLRLDVPDSGPALALTVRSVGRKTRKLSIPTWGSGSREETVELHPADVVRGTVTDESTGEPVRGVSITGSGGASQSEESGEFAHAAGELQVDPTDNFLWFNHPEFCEELVHLSDPPPAPLQVRLRRAASAHLVVLDRTGDAGLDGVGVEMIPTHPRSTKRPVRALDARPGEFEVAGLTPGEWYLGNVSSRDGRNTPFALKVHGQPTEPLVVEVLPRVVVSGTVVTGADDEAGEGYCVVDETLFRMQYVGSPRDPHMPAFSAYWSRGQVIRLDTSGQFRALVSPGRVLIRFVRQRWNHDPYRDVILSVTPEPTEQNLGKIRLDRWR